MSATEVPTLEELLALPPEYMAEDIGQRLMDASIALIVVINVVYVLFILSRVYMAERNYWEVWTIYPISYGFVLTQAILCVFFVTDGGAGRHIPYWLLNDPTAITRFLKYQTASEFVYMAGVTFPKVAILMLYIRIFSTPKVRLMTWIAMGVVLANWVATGIIATFTICQPFAFKWDKTIEDGKCANLMAAYKYISIPNIVTDIAILVLPVPSLWKLHTSKWRKIGIFVTFATGGLGIIMAIVRFVGFYTTDLEADLTYKGVNTMIYTELEPAAYFICSCLPGMRPLARGIYSKSGLQTFVSSRFKSYGDSSGTSHPSKVPSNDITLNSMRGHTKTSVTVPPRKMYQDPERNDSRAFIRLEETFQVGYSPAHSLKRNSSASHPER